MKYFKIGIHVVDTYLKHYEPVTTTKTILSITWEIMLKNGSNSTDLMIGSLWANGHASCEQVLETYFITCIKSLKLMIPILRINLRVITLSVVIPYQKVYPSVPYTIKA